MGDEDNNFQSSKKRAAGVQLTKDNPGLDDDEAGSEQETGTFKRASDEVLAARRIVKVRRNQASATPSIPAQVPSSNPFAAIKLVNAPGSTATSEKVEESTVVSEETEPVDKKDGQSENKVDDEPLAKPAAEETVDANNESVKPSETKIDESEAEKDKAADVSDPNNIVVQEASESEKYVDAINSNVAVNSESEKKEDVEVKETPEKDNVDAGAEKDAETVSFGSFQRLSSSQNAFTGFSGTGFSSSSFSFGSVAKDGSPSSTSGSLFGLKTDQPSFGFGLPSNGSPSIFGATETNITSKSETSKFPPKQEVSIETGEENEKAVFTADSALFEFTDGSWKERGKGELKINVSTTGTGKARLIMRARGNYRLILNASLFPDMKLTNMDKKGITFACVNSAGEGKDGLSTIALKFKDVAIVEEFRAAVTEHKGKTAPNPESSSKASDE